MRSGSFPSAVLWVFILLLFVECSPLSKSQVTLTRNYFSAIANYPDFFEDINVQVADVNLSAKKLDNLFSEDSLKFTSLIPAIRNYEHETIIPDSINVLVDSLNNYIQDYYSLIPSGYNIFTLIKGAGSAVPVFGGMAKAIPDIHLSGSEARRVIRHMNKYGQKLEPIINDLKSWLLDECKESLTRIENTEIKHLQKFDLELQSTGNKYEYFAKSQGVVSSYYQQIFLTHRMIDEMVESLDIILELNDEIRVMNAQRAKDFRSPKSLNKLVRLYQRLEEKNLKIQRLKESRLF